MTALPGVRVVGCWRTLVSRILEWYVSLVRLGVLPPVIASTRLLLPGTA